MQYDAFATKIDPSNSPEAGAHLFCYRSTEPGRDRKPTHCDSFVR